MRARNREINIFNMSLLDILCGALGAFCFMMIAILPYYKPGTGVDGENQQKLDETLKDFDELKEKIKDAELAKELAELIEKLRAQIKELEGRVNSLAAENEELRGQVNSLAARNKDLQEQVRRLWHREPFTVFATCGTVFRADVQGRILLYLWQDNTSEVDKKKQPPFDPTASLGSSYWAGEQFFGVQGERPLICWMVRDVNPDMTWKIYIKLVLWTEDNATPGKKNPIPLYAPMILRTRMSSASREPDPLDVTVTPEHPWALVGFINSDKEDNKKLTLRRATDAEREAEWKALDKKPPAQRKQ